MMILRTHWSRREVQCKVI